MGEADKSRRRRGDLEPNPRMWEALERGLKLRRILEDFYAQVYQDERLVPFFARTTIDWAIDHQYSFLGELFSGEEMFFGDRPRNAHHWMVITDELFDHREALMEATLRKHGLPEDLIAEWRALEESFRSQIVKECPFPKKRRGKELPLEGYEAFELTVGTLCDGCGGELNVGGIARYHVRTGETFCATCRPETRAEPLSAASETP